MVRRAVDNSTLDRWRELDSLLVLRFVAEYLKQDTDYNPRASLGTTRWHANVGGRDYEILCTGAKFHDTRAKHGGGGAVDLVMHLLRLVFKQAVAVLKKSGL
jgi:hypothetical protein